MPILIFCSLRKQCLKCINVRFVSLNVFYFPQPQVLKRIYGSKVCLECMYIYMWILAYNRNDRFNEIKYTLFHKRVKMFFNMCRLLMLFKL